MLSGFRDREVLQKGEAVFGLGKGRMLHIYPDGRTETEGFKNLPGEAYFFMPLVTEIVPEEFLGAGQFTDILALEGWLGEITGRAEDVYKKTGPYLASQGIPAERVAKVVLEMSPIRVMKDTGQITCDAYGGYEKALQNKITKYYPGSTISERERQKPHRNAVDSGKRRGKDGISF